MISARSAPCRAGPPARSPPGAAPRPGESGASSPRLLLVQETGEASGRRLRTTRGVNTLVHTHNSTSPSESHLTSRLEVCLHSCIVSLVIALVYSFCLSSRPSSLDRPLPTAASTASNSPASTLALRSLLLSLTGPIDAVLSPLPAGRVIPRSSGHTSTAAHSSKPRERQPPQQEKE